jgi:hypothetical protein
VERQSLTSHSIWVNQASNFVLGDLEGGFAVAFASGMAGIAAIFDRVPAGSVVALPDDCYQDAWTTPLRRRSISAPDARPLEHQQQLHSTDPLEHLNKEVKRGR